MLILVEGEEEMLPKELLVVIKRGNNIWPKYSRFSTPDINIAEAIIQIYSESIGLKRREIKEKILELENIYGNYKLIRALSLLIERKCEFIASYSIDPKKIRHLLFEEASILGYPTTFEERNNIIKIVANKLNIKPEDVEQSIYADLNSEDKLSYFQNINAIDLLKEYNFSITQTLLFNATEIDFTSSGNWQRIFRAIKYYGLMYTNKEGKWFKIDGPASIFKLTRRYGTAIAKLLPEIFASQPWQIQAIILYKNKLLRFELNSKKYSWLFPKIELKESYDSTIEEDFANEFKTLKTPWIIKRESDPILINNCIIIPDFSFYFENKRVLMEIVGFWTIDYLKRKIEKLKFIKDPIIVAVNEDLACGKIEKLSSLSNFHIIYYKDKIPIKEVLNFLNKIMEEEIKTYVTKLELNIKKPIETIDEIAKRLNISPEVVKAASNKVKTHLLIGDYFIEKELMEKIRDIINNIVKNETPLKEVIKALENFGLPDIISIITACGFQIKWHGISIENAYVKKLI
ncbi:MAG: DUF790 family protein [Candidatus Methanomethylicaceae archaeon]